MIDSPLSAFARRRLENLHQVDRHCCPDDQLENSNLWNRPRPSLQKALTPPSDRPTVLFEVKKASPSLGNLSQSSALELCQRYIDAGAPAVSVLVDQIHFQGHPQDLLDCTTTFPNTPFLFKDFVVTPYQVRLAKALGASSVLLMTQLLEKHELLDLYKLCLDLELEPFVETHSDAELHFALDLNPPIIGINARDFWTEGLPVDLSTTPKRLQALQESWPEGTVLVAQSGITHLKDVQQLCAQCPKGLPHAIQVGSRLSQVSSVPEWLKTMSSSQN